MSYCRWSECDVYAYDSCEGGVRFYVAGDDSLNRLCGTYNEAYQYAKELRDKHGLDVPSYAIDALQEDAIDEAKRYFGSDSAVAERISENAKLRELLRYNGAVIEACTGEILDHIGVPYIVGPAGVAQALMEATAMLVHKRYDFDPPSFYKEDK